MADQTASADAAAPATEVPEGWASIEGLVCGFGNRDLEPPASTLLLRKQVHGRVVVDASCVPRVAAPGDGYVRLDVEADAAVAARPQLVVGVRTADCVPLLLVAPRSGWSAAVHAGWRGTLAGIAGEAVREAAKSGVRPEQILAALGPSIGPCCYEVSVELAADFTAAGLAVVHPPGAARPHIDLRESNRRVLIAAGVPAASVQMVGPCTKCAHDRYHSYRAEPDSGGRQVSWVGWADRTRAPDRAPTR